jgi:uracil-DNA glycosylase family 4
MTHSAIGCEPARDCNFCPRLNEFRETNKLHFPDWHNAPVASFGPPDARLLIVGLAPGLKGANRTGRPFTGDYAGDLLYATLLGLGLARGRYGAGVSDGLELVDCRITNAVRCVPPANKPTPAEINQCRPFLTGLLSTSPHLKVVVALGRIAHDSVLGSLGLRKAAHPFRHGQDYAISSQLTLFDSYHCSRYNTNTGVLTSDMFRDVLSRAAARAVR